jgi:hypothetical protein
MSVTSTFVFLVCILLQVLFYEVIAIKEDGYTISRAVWVWHDKFSYLSVIVGLGMAFLWVHFFKHDWLIYLWNRFV